MAWLGRESARVVGATDDRLADPFAATEQMKTGTKVPVEKTRRREGTPVSIFHATTRYVRRPHAAGS
jgi:hypothetical protein